MTFDVEILLRERPYAVTERLETTAPPASWTEDDVEHVLKSILLAMNRVKNPEDEEGFVALRGFSWIVEPTIGGVVIAIEIPMGAAVAGPFAVEQQKLDSLISRVIAAASPVRPVVH